MSNYQVSVIIPAAGRAVRFASPQSKILAELAGRPMIFQTLSRFLPLECVRQIIVALGPNEMAVIGAEYCDHLADKRIQLVGGGDRRCDTVAGAVARVAGGIDLIAVHDAARPLVDGEVIERAFQGAAEHGAALAAIPLYDTIKRADKDNRVMATVSRKDLYCMQTPQVFEANLLRTAIAQWDGSTITDDAQWIEAIGHPVHLVLGSRRNFKVTTTEDLALAERLWSFVSKSSAGNGLKV